VNQHDALAVATSTRPDRRRRSRPVQVSSLQIHGASGEHDVEGKRPSSTALNSRNGCACARRCRTAPAVRPRLKLRRRSLCTGPRFEVVRGPKPLTSFFEPAPAGQPRFDRACLAVGRPPCCCISSWPLGDGFREFGGGHAIRWPDLKAFEPMSPRLEVLQKSASKRLSGCTV